ncbi:MAG: hypothetical protein QXQ91_00670 [Nanopusillaceae archaeon]
MISFFKKFLSKKKSETLNRESYTLPEFSKISQSEKTSFDKYYEKNYEKEEEIDSLRYQIQIINSKLDTLLAKIDNITIKINYLENLINSILYYYKR